MKTYGIIAAIFVLALTLRFYHLTGAPASLNSDETAIGFNAYSILKTGRDEYNQRFPITFRSFDDYKMPVYVYLVAGSMSLFGYNDFSVRFPSALLGSLTVVCTYLLVIELFGEKSRRAAAVSAFLLSISPWSVFFSRSGYEANIAVFFMVFGSYLFLRGLRNGKLLVLSGLCFSLAVWSYLSARIFVPLLLLAFGIVYMRQIMKQMIPAIATTILCGVLLWPIISMTLSHEGQMRAKGVSAFENPDVVRMVNFQSLWSVRDKNRVLSSVFHNRRIEYAQTFIRGYFSHFDLNFLFLDRAVEKYRAPGMGLMYLFELPFLLCGLYVLLRSRTKGSYMMISWILAAPAAAAFTSQLPHPVRTLTFLPALQIITAVGITEAIAFAIRLRRSRTGFVVLGSLFVVLASWNVLYFFHQYFIHMPVDYAKYWYAGRKEMVEKLKRVESQYDTIYVSNKLDFPYIFYLYYGKIDPAQYLASGGTKSGGFKEEGNAVGKYEFRTISTALENTDKRILFVAQPVDVFPLRLIKDTIPYPDGSPAIIFF